MTTTPAAAALRLAVDIGGTFTDVVLERAGVPSGTALLTAKVLTTPAAPDQGVIDGIADVLARAGVTAGEVGLLLHGTTLATNAILERRGATTALIGTDGFRDILDIGYENRHDQYDLNLAKPRPLVPRARRFTVPERVDVRGRVLRPLDEAAVAALAPELRRLDVDSVAIGFLHAYANPAHERRCAEILAGALPGLAITLSSEVCPEVREYERLSTAVANAYVQPLMASYLHRLRGRLERLGLTCPVLLMTSGGGLTTLDTAARFPIRLVESGPAGGAILASHIAAELGLDRVLSFDMGGTTAKICLLENATPQTAREFEVDRSARFMKGSGLPLRIPVIEMVEIGAGGGSIARVDAMGQITIGPDSAGADPGPAAYGRGGAQPTISDADIALGKIDPARFAGGKVVLQPALALRAIDEAVAGKLGIDTAAAAYGIGEMVDETMANAARVHAVERGRNAAEHTLIAFGGAAPLHVCRLAEKLNIGRVVIPANAGVGSAVGFLRAPVKFEVVRSRNARLADADLPAIDRLLDEMRAEALAVVSAAGNAGGHAGAAPRYDESRYAYMRYLGQGHEILVPLPDGALDDSARQRIAAAFDRVYAALYRRTIPNGDIEILTWGLSLSLPLAAAALPATTTGTAACFPADLATDSATDLAAAAPAPAGVRTLLDPAGGAPREVPLYWRADLRPGQRVDGPAVVAEAETSTFVSAAFRATPGRGGHLLLERRPPSGA